MERVLNGIFRHTDQSPAYGHHRSKLLYPGQQEAHLPAIVQRLRLLSVTMSFLENERNSGSFYPWYGVDRLA